jgi:L-ascorbate metabolism protein UlaG (beta-lactamase superfamily)
VRVAEVAKCVVNTRLPSVNMKSSSRSAPFLWLCLSLCGTTAPSAIAQTEPQFTRAQRLSNNEIALTLAAPTGIVHRIDACTEPESWQGLVTLLASTNTSLQYTDSAAPYVAGRFYRAESVFGTNVFSGDHLVTTNGDVLLQPRFHATCVLNWNGVMIYCDPDDAATYTGLAKADLILVTHSHGDHLSVTSIDAVRGPNAVIIAPQDVYNQLTLQQRAITRVLGYGGSTNLLGLTVEAVAAYNANHPFGFGNGYVLTIGGRRIYFSGDTGNTVELRQLPNIDVAFLCMNQPFTMTVSDATNAVTAFRPKVVYPYHYRDQSGATTNAAAFKQRLNPNLGVEVRLRSWY